jgi:hypothetical protein
MSVKDIASYILLSEALSEPRVESIAAPTSAEKESMRKREADAIRKEMKREADKGKGVTKEAQELYDHITRTYVAPFYCQTIPSFLYN